MAVRPGMDNVELRAAATLLATAAFSSDQLACHGLAQIAFKLTATDADLLASAQIEVSDDEMNVAAAGSLWQAVATGMGVGATATGALEAMNAGGKRAMLHSIGLTTGGGRGIPWRKCRITGVADAADIAGLRITATGYDFQ